MVVESGTKWCRVVDVMFMGEFQHNIDTKGRIIVPARFREELGKTMIVAKWFDHCLALHTRDYWEKLNASIAQLPVTKKQSRDVQRSLTAAASEVEPDVQGRILIPATLVKLAQLKKACVIVGVNDHVEIWSKPAWDAYIGGVNDQFDDLAEQLTEYLP